MQPLVERILAPQGSFSGSPSPALQPPSALEGLRNEVNSWWPELATVFLFAALVAFAIPWHEPWSDEAQAWQLARSLSLRALFQTYIRYEASPGLWHFMLWVLIRAHVSYSGLHWICGAIATAATSLLVFKSPFPRYLKLALPFTFFLLFQYAVVARSYVLVPLLLFLIASGWKKSPVAVALLLGLLANVALHTSVISAGLAIVYFFEQVCTGSVKDPCRRRQLLFFSVILVCFYAFALWTAWPPHDLAFKRSSGPLPFVILWRLLNLCQPWCLSIPFWIAIAICLRARCALFYLLPAILFVLFSLAVYVNFWHVGLQLPLAVCLLWITWPAPGGNASGGESIARKAMIVMASLQILWSAYAIKYDHYNAYSPDLATSEFLRPFVRQGATIAVTYMNDPDGRAFRSVGILPYFDHNIFVNQQDSFWWWSTQNRNEEEFKEALPSHPAVVVVEVRPSPPDLPINLRDPKIQLLDQAGYRFTNMFCGAMPEGFQQAEKSCHLIFQRAEGAQEPSANQASQASVPK